MRIFITGSDGFIGSELIAHLSHSHPDFQIVPYDHKNGNDILDAQRMTKAMAGCDVVVHLAAIKKPLEDKTFEDYFRVNCEGTFNVAEAAMKNNVKKLIFASSMAYYGAERGMPVELPITEKTYVMTQKLESAKLTEETRPCDIAYSTSKVISEQILSNYGLPRKMQVIILRLGPTRKRGEYRPFGSLKQHLKIENALQALELAITSRKELWFEAFTIVDDNIENVGIEKAKRMLDYKPI
jgi:nucleoside-diphosphate-sugar epimerase